MCLLVVLASALSILAYTHFKPVPSLKLRSLKFYLMREHSLKHIALLEFQLLELEQVHQRIDVALDIPARQKFKHLGRYRGLSGVR